MSVFDKLQNYSASSKPSSVASEVFNVSTPEGCFLAKLHSQGYLMYEYYYENELTGKTLTADEYSWLQDHEQVGYKRKIKYTELHDMLTTEGDQLVLANAGSGKALTNNTKVLTPNGYYPIGDLCVGDTVFGTDLKEHKVVGVYPQGRKRVCELTIESDRSRFLVDCCEEHLWSIQYFNRVETITTKDVKRKLETLNSLPLVVPSPYIFDYRGNIDMLDISKAVVLFRVLCRMLGLRDAVVDAYNKNSDMCFEVDLMWYDKSTVAYILELQTYLENDLVCIKSNNNGSYYLSIITRFYSTTLCTIDNFNDYLTNFLATGCYDCLKIFDGKECSFRIIAVNERDYEADMTCIEVDSDNHLFLIEHLIPTHNTTALIFKIMHDIITGEATKLTSIPNGSSVRVVDDVFVGTFLKSGADELAERLAYWQRGMGYTVTADRVSFSTLHAEFKRALNAMGASTPIGKPQDITKCLKKAIDGLGITRDGGNLTSEDYNVIGGIVTYYRGRLDEGKYTHPSALDYGLTPMLLDRLVNDFSNQRQLLGIMDFEDLQELLYKFLYLQPNKAVQDFCANRYKYIYLDEFQDTSQIQYAILKFYARGRLWINRGCSSPEEETSPLFVGCESLGKIIGVGDPDQTIYSWRGSDNKIIEVDFDNDFKPCLCKLSYNYRCPSNILDVIVPSIKINGGHENREYHSSREGGLVKGYHFTSYNSMLTQLVEDITEDMNEGNTIAILCRTNYDGVIPAFILESSKKYDFSISGLNMTFDSPLPRKLIAVTSIFTERSSLAVKNTLSMFVSRYAQWEVKQLIDTLKTNNKSIWQLPYADIEYSCNELAGTIKTIKSFFYENGKRVQSKEIKALKYVYNWIRVNTFGGTSLYCESARAYIESLLYIIDINNFESVFEFLDYVNTLNENLHARINNPKAKICIATVHEFKGKERDSVIVWNDSDGVFPSSKTNLDNLSEVEEERRVHYVACTRAKKKSRIYTMYGREGIFVKEMDLEFESPQKLGGSLNSSNKKDEELSEDEANLLELLDSES